MNVRVCGPNLNTGRNVHKETFHVHADGCNDLKHYGPGRKYGGDVHGFDEMLVENATVMAIVYETYCDIIAERVEDEQQTEEEAARDLASDFWFAPCCQLEYTEGEPGL